MLWHEIDCIVARMLLYSTNITYSKYIFPKISRVFYEAWQIINCNPKQLISVNNQHIVSDFLVSANTVLDLSKTKDIETQIKLYVKTKHIIINNELYLLRILRIHIESILTSFANRLVSLDIRYCDTIIDSDIKCIANMPRLKSLKLVSCEQISDLSMVYISTNTTLTSLCLTGKGIIGICVSSLYTCINLKSLTLSFEIMHSSLGDHIHWPINVNINKLSIATEMLPYVLVCMPVILSVTQLDLTNAGADSYIVEHVERISICFPNITGIILARSIFINQDIHTILACIKRCNCLKRITVDISDFKRPHIWRFFTLFSEQLTHIKLTAGTNNISLQSPTYLSERVSISHINLSNMYADTSLSMTYITECHNIINLKLHRCVSLQDIDLKYLNRLKYLAKIEFVEAPLLTNQCAEYLLQCRKLIKIKFKDCNLISNDIISMLHSIPLVRKLA
jgi:hypothetical protein